MAKGFFVQDGKVLDYKNDGSAAIAYGDVVALTACIGVAECDIPKGGIGALSVSGVYELPADTSAAFTMGQALFWDSTSGTVKGTTSSGLIPCGFAAAPKESSATICFCKIG